MAYTKLNWLNKGETGAIPINKDNLNHMDNGISNNDSAIGNLANLNTPVKDNLVNAINSTVVESGSNSNGSYIKYSDGTMICTKRFIQQNVKLTNSWFSLFTNENDTRIDLGNYAATFIEEPVVNITYMGGNGCWLINNNGHSASSPGKVQLCTVSSRTIGTCILDITAKGRWK